MVDVSGSMTMPIAPGQTRVALLEQLTIASIERTPGGNAHRTTLVAAANLLPGLVAKNGDTGLYDSAWAA